MPPMISIKKRVTIPQRSSETEPISIVQGITAKAIPPIGIPTKTEEEPSGRSANRFSKLGDFPVVPSRGIQARKASRNAHRDAAPTGAYCLATVLAIEDPGHQLAIRQIPIGLQRIPKTRTISSCAYSHKKRRLQTPAYQKTAAMSRLANSDLPHRHAKRFLATHASRHIITPAPGPTCASLHQNHGGHALPPSKKTPPPDCSSKPGCSVVSLVQSSRGNKPATSDHRKAAHHFQCRPSRFLWNCDIGLQPRVDESLAGNVRQVQ